MPFVRFWFSCAFWGAKSCSILAHIGVLTGSPLLSFYSFIVWGQSTKDICFSPSFSWKVSQTFVLANSENKAENEIKGVNRSSLEESLRILGDFEYVPEKIWRAGGRRLQRKGAFQRIQGTWREKQWAYNNGRFKEKWAFRNTKESKKWVKDGTKSQSWNIKQYRL